jgi:hypothetical protein
MNDPSRLKGYEIAPRVVDPAKFLIALAQGALVPLNSNESIELI